MYIPEVQNSLSTNLDLQNVEKLNERRDIFEETRIVQPCTDK